MVKITDYLKDYLNSGAQLYDFKGFYYIFYTKGSNPFRSDLSVVQFLSKLSLETGEVVSAWALGDGQTAEGVVKPLRETGGYAECIMVGDK